MRLRLTVACLGENCVDTTTLVAIMYGVLFVCGVCRYTWLQALHRIHELASWASLNEIHDQEASI
jgi:hypothetical protein